MKSASKKLFYILIVIVSLWGAFYTENLTEKRQQEKIAQYNPEQLVADAMSNSLDGLQNRAVTLSELVAGIETDSNLFAQKYGRTLGIGSPVFYVVKGQYDAFQLVQGEKLQGTMDGVAITIPLKYIFGNTARDASGWFNIDNFQNTMDFNAVSAAMNAYISNQLKNFHFIPSTEIEFIGAVAIPANISQIEQITLIPYQLK